MATLNFDATQVAPDTGAMDPVPADWYNVLADESEMKPTKDAQGAYLQVRFTIIDGHYAGRKLFSRFNLKNASAQAQEIGYKQLSAFAHAVGVLRVEDSGQLHGIPLKVKVKVRPAKDDYEAANDITSYKNVNDPSAVPKNIAPTTGGMPPAMGGALGGMPAGFGNQVAPQMQQPVPQMQQPAQQPVQQQVAAGWGQQAPVQQMQPQQAPVQQQPQQPWQQQAAPVEQQAPVQQPVQQPQAQQQVQQSAAPTGAVPPWQQPAGQQPWQTPQ